MNYAVAVGAGIAIFSLGWWWAGARKYVFPSHPLHPRLKTAASSLDKTMDGADVISIGHMRDPRPKTSSSLSRRKKETTNQIRDLITGVLMANEGEKFGRIQEGFRD